MESYEITMTISPSKIIPYYGKSYGKLLASEQWEWLQYHIYHIFNGTSCEYVIYPEFHKNFNLHIHGHVFIDTKMCKMKLVDIKKRIEEYGRSNFKPVYNILNWLSYIKKDYDELQMKVESENYQIYLRTSLRSDI